VPRKNRRGKVTKEDGGEGKGRVDVEKRAAKLEILVKGWESAPKPRRVTGKGRRRGKTCSGKRRRQKEMIGTPGVPSTAN